MTPLCIIQARYHSTRLPGKMLLPLDGETIIARAWRLACEVFGEPNVVVAIPGTDVLGPLGAELARIGAQSFAYDGYEADVLGRFHACAHRYRHDPTSVIVRVTPDDVPIDVTRERITLGWLDWQHAVVRDTHRREHIGLLIAQRVEINTREDYEKARARYV